MGEYTESLESIGYDIDLFENDPEVNVEVLTNIASRFRSFDVTITEFIIENGFQGNKDNIKEKIEYISAKFSNANISVPRNIRRWFTEKIGIEKIPTGFQFCFAFNLSISDSNDFFRRICLEKGIDCHVIEEAVYYYCIKNKIAYEEAQAVINDIEKAERYGDNNEILYTSAIALDIDKVTSIDELKAYLIKNKNSFVINKVTATSYVRRMWEEISEKKGLANAEISSHHYDDEFAKRVASNKKPSKQKELKSRSTWEIYKQILGLDEFKNPDFEKNRSIKSILKSNSMLQQNAEKDFPDRLGIDNIIAGRVVSTERMRKVLILLAFYRYWIKLADKRKNYDAAGGDADRCQAEMNQILLESGYQELYYGNPYDWIFLFSMQTESPLDTFREYIATLKIKVTEE